MEASSHDERRTLQTQRAGRWTQGVPETSERAADCHVGPCWARDAIPCPCLDAAGKRTPGATLRLAPRALSHPAAAAADGHLLSARRLLDLDDRLASRRGETAGGRLWQRSAGASGGRALVQSMAFATFTPRADAAYSRTPSLPWGRGYEADRSWPPEVHRRSRGNTNTRNEPRWG